MNKEYLKDDLIKLDYHINEIIDSLICSSKDKEFKKDIEEVQIFLSYWIYHTNKN
tara:strand:+ start:947 stop:1111 length:165 start_codon:yes stop_codon:yes gene_type:complete